MPTVWKLAAVGQLRDHRGVDVHAHGAHRGGQHVAHGDAVQHGAEHEAGAGLLRVAAHLALRLLWTSRMTSGIGPSSRMLPASTNGVPVLTQRVHEAAAEHALLDGGGDAAAAPDRC